MKDKLRRIGLGRVAYQLYYAPVGLVRNCLRDGGPIEQRRTTAGRNAMLRAAIVLPSVAAPPPEAPEVHFLTGRTLWYQTAFCFWTLLQHAGRPLRAVVHDDGSLTPENKASLLRVFPGMRIETDEAATTRLDATLPESRYPWLRARRRSLVLFRKLLDIHAGMKGWRLFLDSDQLFFRRPEALLTWLDKAEEPLHMVDVERSYGYSPSLLAELAGAPERDRVNTGILGLRSDGIDWDKVEYWCRTLIERAGTHYYQEQALVAMLLAGHKCISLPSSDYVVLPQPPEVLECQAVVHHYVATSKRWYFQHCWRRAITPPSLGVSEG